MSELHLALKDDRTAFRPGETLSGGAYWKLDAPADSLEVRLFWFTRGKGSEDVAVIETVRFEQPKEEEARAFQFQLPDAPYSFSGNLISLVWAIELVARPSKETARLEFTLSPDGKELRLGSLPKLKPGKSSITWRRR